jgi:hypothetical protein
MSQLGFVKYSYLAYLSRPASDRPIYRRLRQHPVRNIVEIGIGSGVRTERMIQMAASVTPDSKIHYTGIDLFEARPPSHPGMTLKRAYRMLRRLPVEFQLVPGDPFTALVRMANNLTGTDLLVVAVDQDPQQMARAWVMVPRMLHEHSLILLERGEGDQVRFEKLSRFEIEAMSGASRRQLRSAA